MLIDEKKLTFIRGKRKKRAGGVTGYGYNINVSLSALSICVRCHNKMVHMSSTDLLKIVERT